MSDLTPTPAKSYSPELITLRVSVARIAQRLGVDNALTITGDNYGALCHKAKTNDVGWNDLAGACFDKIATLDLSTEG